VAKFIPIIGGMTYLVPDYREQLPMGEDETEALDKLRVHIHETRSFFGPKMKPERERSVCRAFLRCLGVAFDEAEIRASTTEPIDVEFRAAKFQIRELLDPGRKRGRRVKRHSAKI
jgi:hypothetical protein